MYKLQHDKTSHKIVKYKDNKKYLTINDKIRIYNKTLIALICATSIGLTGPGLKKTLFKNNKYEININEATEIILSDDEVTEYIKEKYETLTKEEKNNFVSSFVINKVESNDEFSYEQKELVKKDLTPFLSEWGYLYEVDNLLGVNETLEKIKIGYYDKFDNDDIKGQYIAVRNRICLLNGNNKYISHELDHSITVGAKYQLNKSIKRTDQFPSIILEGINSSIDLTYNNNDTYNNQIRSQMIFLSLIIGRENLMYCYQNCDYDKLIELIGRENEELITLLNKEYSEFVDNGYELDEKTCKQVADKMKDMYEKKYNCKIDETTLPMIIYKLSQTTCDYRCEETLFYENKFTYYIIETKNEQKYEEKYIIDTEKDELDLDNSLKVNKILYNHSHKQEEMINKKLKYLIVPEIYENILNKSTYIEALDYLETYLRNTGIKHPEIFINLTLSNEPLFQYKSYGYYNDKDEYMEDLVKVYQNKLEYLQSKNKEYLIYDNYQNIFKENNDDIFNEKYIIDFMKKVSNNKYDEKSLIKLKDKYLKIKIDENISEIKDMYNNNSKDLNERISKLITIFTEEEVQKILNADDMYKYLYDKLDNTYCDKFDIIYYLLTEEIYHTDHQILNILFYDKYKTLCENGEILIAVAEFNEFMEDNFEFIKECDLISLAERLYDEENIYIENRKYINFRWILRDYDDIYNSRISYYKECENTNYLELPYINDTFYSFYEKKANSKVEIEIKKELYDDIIIVKKDNKDAMIITGNEKQKTLSQLGYENNLTKRLER